MHLKSVLKYYHLLDPYKRKIFEQPLFYSKLRKRKYVILFTFNHKGLSCMKGKGSSNISMVSGFSGPLVNGSDLKINPPNAYFLF